MGIKLAVWVQNRQMLGCKLCAGVAAWRRSADLAGQDENIGRYSMRAFLSYTSTWREPAQSRASSVFVGTGGQRPCVRHVMPLPALVNSDTTAACFIEGGYECFE